MPSATFSSASVSMWAGLTQELRFSPHLVDPDRSSNLCSPRGVRSAGGRPDRLSALRPPPEDAAPLTHSPKPQEAQTGPTRGGGHLPPPQSAGSRQTPTSSKVEEFPLPVSPHVLPIILFTHTHTHTSAANQPQTSGPPFSHVTSCFPT